MKGQHLHLSKKSQTVSEHTRQNIDTAIPLYSGEENNPSLGRFVERHLKERPYCPDRDHYVIADFHQNIETTKRSPIYSMHAYHLGKKPHDAVAQYIRNYTNQGDLVLDPFCGSGSTALAALLCGRKAIAIDASPAATFVSRFYLSGTNPQDLAERFQSMSSQVSDVMNFLYGTTCHRCGYEAHIHYVIYSNVYACPQCGTLTSLYEATSAHQSSCCPYCLADSGRRIQITPNLGVIGYEPVAVNYSCHGSCKPKRLTRSLAGTKDEKRAFLEIDLPRIKELESQSIPYWTPSHFMMHVRDESKPWGDEWRPSRNFRRVADLFTHRNLWALAALFNAAGADNDLRAVLTSGMLAVSKKAQHLRGGGGYIPGTWSLPPMSKQRHVLETMNRVFRTTLKAKKLLWEHLRNSDACISTQSATCLCDIPSNSIDYIFTDPPYGDAVQYAELNFVWESWLGFSSSWHDQEVVVNKNRNKSEDDWGKMMQEAMSECHRVLKPGRRLSLCFHSGSGKMWSIVQQVMRNVGFVPCESAGAVAIDTGSHTYNQRVTEKPVKRDLVINFRKPHSVNTSASTSHGPNTSLKDLELQAKHIIIQYLMEHSGAKKDRIFDHFMSTAIRSGLEMDMDFDRLLCSVASQDDRKKWYVLQREEGS